MNVTEVFKGEEGVEYPAQIDITTRANSALCGIYLELGTEYLLDLYRYVHISNPKFLCA